MGCCGSRSRRACLPCSLSNLRSAIASVDMKISELASKVGARLENCPEDLEITGLAPVEEATAGQLAFVPSVRDLAAAKRTRASAVILPSRFPPLPLPT